MSLSYQWLQDNFDAINTQSASSESNIITQVASSETNIITQIASSETNIIAALPNDSVGDALVTIDYAHHEIHGGSFYTTSRYESVGAASTVSLLLTTPSAGSAICHLTGAILADGAGVWTWSEAPNASGGTAITPYNNNRTSANAANLTVTYDPTFVSSGTVLAQSHLGTYAPSVNVGGQFSNRQEWILEEETIYLIRFTADGASCRTTIIVEFYEET